MHTLVGTGAVGRGGSGGGGLDISNLMKPALARGEMQVGGSGGGGEQACVWGARGGPGAQQSNQMGVAVFRPYLLPPPELCLPALHQLLLSAVALVCVSFANRTQGGGGSLAVVLLACTANNPSALLRLPDCHRLPTPLFLTGHWRHNAG